LWYIAKSYHDGYRDVENLPFGKDHSDEYARRVIFYYNQYLNRMHDFKNKQHSKSIDDMGYYACMLIAEAYEWIGDTDMALYYLKVATTFNPRRNEHYVKLAQMYRKLEQWENMAHVTGMLVNPERANPFPEFSFLIENSAYFDTGNLCNELHEIALNGLNS